LTTLKLWLNITLVMKNKKIIKTDEFSKGREFAVILEKIYTDIKALGEGQAVLRDKMDTTIGMVAKNTEDVTMLNLSMSVVKSDLTKISGKLAKIEEDIRIIKSDFDKRLTHLEALK
jgi:predicted translin family RNA/ssDNA-binding protein